jgi:hypothetical protein
MVFHDKALGWYQHTTMNTASAATSREQADQWRPGYSGAIGKPQAGC